MNPAPPRAPWRGLFMAAVTLAYPLLVYFSIGRIAPHWVALLPLTAAVLRVVDGRRDTLSVVLLLCALAVMLPSLAGHGSTMLKLYPALVSLALLLTFSATLIWPPTLIERIARAREPDLPPRAVAYTRRVTQVWCGFFVINAAISLWTVWHASDAIWALYNGLISYVLMGLLMTAELLVRRRVRGRNG